MDCYSPQCKAAAAQATRKLQLKIKVMKFKKFWLLVVVVLEVDKGPQDHKLGKGGGGGGGGFFKKSI